MARKTFFSRLGGDTNRDFDCLVKAFGRVVKGIMSENGRVVKFAARNTKLKSQSNHHFYEQELICFSIAREPESILVFGSRETSKC